jgi:hypothetical protein
MTPTNLDNRPRGAGEAPTDAEVLVIEVVSGERVYKDKHSKDALILLHPIR